MSCKNNHRPRVNGALWWIYQLLFAAGFTVLLPYFLLRMKRRGGYRRFFMERFACYSCDFADGPAGGRPVWIQAVSVGEVFVALRIIDALRRQVPELRFVISTNTSTGRRVAAKRMDNRDKLIYFPIDIPPVTCRAIRCLRPRALLLVENEMWPNLLRACYRRGVPVYVVNGRISEHSFRGYRKLRLFTRRLLPVVSHFYVQSANDGERLRMLGAPQDRISVVGSAKYEVAERDAVAEQQAVAYLARVAGTGRRILLGGSTWPGEEMILAEIYRRLRREIGELFLVLVPRHAERSPELERRLRQSGLTVCRKTADNCGGSPPDVLLVDTTGELSHFYAAAELIFVGKSLTEHGGQNIIEPALCGRPVLVGPNMENFPVVMNDFLKADAVLQVRDADELEDVVRRLLADPGERASLGNRARSVVIDRRGALQNTARRLLTDFGLDYSHASRRTTDNTDNTDN